MIIINVHLELCHGSSVLNNSPPVLRSGTGTGIEVADHAAVSIMVETM